VNSGASVWHRYGVLRLAGARLLDDRDRGAVRVVLDADPVATCMVAARVELAGLDPWRLGGEMWAFGSRLDGLCFSGANLVPLHGGRQALRSFADRARRHGRGCSSIVGRAELVLPLWHDLSGHWTRPREVRADQPLMVLSRAGEGRVALLLSDHAWLWTRGFEGGGPQAELLRRMAHWSMKEPELEEEALSGRQQGNDLIIERRTMADQAADVTVTSPSGLPRRCSSPSAGAVPRSPTWSPWGTPSAGSTPYAPATSRPPTFTLTRPRRHPPTGPAPA